MAVIDCVSFNGEYDMLNLRLRMLKPYVDQFIIIESFHTFTGNRKPLYFMQKERLYRKYNIKYHVIDENYTEEEIYLANTSPNTRGALHWKNEFLQKESIKRALNDLEDEDICYIGDVDEVWNPNYQPILPEKLKLKVYAYYLDNHSSEEFWGTFVAKYKTIKNSCLNHLRTNRDYRGSQYGGWHFTSMGGLKEVQRKLNSSYTYETYNNFDVQYHLPERIRQGTDFLGRPFEFKIDESEWPDYLKKHRASFAHLCKGISHLRS